MDTLLKFFRQKQNYVNIAYLLTALPLSLCYLPILILGLVMILSSFVIIGIPLALLFIGVWWQLAKFERKRTMSLLHIDIPEMAVPLPPNLTRFQRFQAHMGRAVTWKSLLYLFLYFPFSVFSFITTILLLVLILVFCIVSLVFCFLGAPFAYLYVLLFTKREIDSRALQQYMLFSVIGFGLALTPLYVVNTLATLWGQFARSMLGLSDQAARLAEAEKIAEQERNRAELAEKRRRDMVINASHELRTPVASIRGHIESLLTTYEERENGMLDTETLHEYLTIIHRESLRLGTLIDDVLVVARAESDTLRVHLNTVRANEVVEEVYQTLMPLAKRERQIVLLRHVPPQILHVQADRQRLVQVLLNLVRNAITYTPDGGLVSINLQQADGQYVELSVADTGIGIPEADQERIFERFYRTDASRARTSGGFGLGLAIVRDFVIAMGGTITVQSIVGEGSCFRVLLRTI